MRWVKSSRRQSDNRRKAVKVPINGAEILGERKEGRRGSFSAALRSFAPACGNYPPPPAAGSAADVDHLLHLNPPRERKTPLT